jgi:hypothetical protein
MSWKEAASSSSVVIFHTLGINYKLVITLCTLFDFTVTVSFGKRDISSG